MTVYFMTVYSFMTAYFSLKPQLEWRLNL